MVRFPSVGLRDESMSEKIVRLNSDFLAHERPERIGRGDDRFGR